MTAEKKKRIVKTIKIDVDKCNGCRACEVACGEAHGMLVPEVVSDGALETSRKTSDRQYTVVNRYETEKGEVFVKRQCMHCHQAACASACSSDAEWSATTPSTPCSSARRS